MAWVGVARARGGWTMTQPGLAGQEVAARAEEAAEGGEDVLLHSFLLHS
jgi:hypothetical protein